MRTKISDQTTDPVFASRTGSIVTGLGALAVTVKVSLFGPFASHSAISCTGKPYWRGTLSAHGDGTYETAPVAIDRVGYYTYRETIAGSRANHSTATACAEVPETTLATADPVVTTIVSNGVVRRGAALYDRIRVSGLGKTPVRIGVELFGPFGARSEIGCTGAPYWQGIAYAKGDGELRSPSVRLAKVGFYTYRERILQAQHVAETETKCALVSETALAAPAINTGRGQGGAAKRVSQPDPRAPIRVAIRSLGINAPVSPAGINVAKGELDANPNVRLTSWWRDGGAPGANTGTVLIAGHVDSAAQGPGAFFHLKEARVGDRITVTSRSGSVRTYRVVSLRTMPKAQLPTDIYSTRGRPRLALVTCGGPFLEAAGHYRDNVVVIAVPVWSAKRLSARCATRPASKSEPVPPRAMRHHRYDEGASRPVDDAGVVPCAGDPARLVQRGRSTSEEPVELAAVCDMGEQVQEIPCVGGREPREPPGEPPFALGRQVNVGEELCEVVGTRRFPDAVVGPLVDAPRNRVPPRKRPRDVAAVHLRVDETEPPHERVDPMAASSRRTAEEALELVGGDVVRIDDRAAQEAVGVRARRRLAAERS